MINLYNTHFLPSLSSHCSLFFNITCQLNEYTSHSWQYLCFLKRYNFSTTMLFKIWVKFFSKIRNVHAVLLLLLPEEPRFHGLELRKWTVFVKNVSINKCAPFFFLLFMHYFLHPKYVQLFSEWNYLACPFISTCELKYDNTFFNPVAFELLYIGGEYYFI